MEENPDYLSSAVANIRQRYFGYWDEGGGDPKIYPAVVIHCHQEQSVVFDAYL
jgi:hypothetical protein